MLLIHSEETLTCATDFKKPTLYIEETLNQGLHRSQVPNMDIENTDEI